MVSRTVSVTLTAQVGAYIANFRAAEDATRQLETRTKTVSEQLRAQQEVFRKHNEALRTLGVGFVAVGATAAVGLALAIKASTDFGAKMAQLQSLSHANETTMRRAAEAAMSVGTAYGFTASQVADAQIELQKAGIGVEQQLGGALKGALSLAAAGQLEVGRATEITTVAMTQFGLSARQVPHLADLLSAGADKALGSVDQLGEALQNGGLQAHNMGLTLDDTVGLLSAFANAGILGAEAGTQMRSMFLRLQNPTKESKQVLDEYGISINDASGHFVGITKFAGELRDQLGKLDPATRNAALATVFGSHAIVGASVLYNAGAKDIAGWISKVNESGFASAQAAGKLNSLQGDATKLGAAFQTSLIKSGSGANDMLRHLTQSATGLITFIGDIPEPLLTAGTGVTALVAGVGLLGGAALIAVPKIVLMRNSLRDLGISGRQAAGYFGKGSALLVGVGLLSAGLAAAAQQGIASAQQISQAGVIATHGWKGMDKLFAGDGGFLIQSGLKNALAGEQFQAGSAKILDTWSFGLTHLSDVYKQNEGAFGALGEQLAGLAQQDYGRAASSFADLTAKYHLNADQTKRLLDLMPAYRDELAKQAGAAHVNASAEDLVRLAAGKGANAQILLARSASEAAKSSGDQAGVLASLAGQASSATTNIDDLQKAIEGFGSAQLDARAATRAMYQAIDDATDSAKTNGRTLDVHTKEGRANAAALDGIATAADAAASKVLKQTGDTAKAQAVMQTARTSFIRVAESMGLGATEAKKLADKLGLVPSNISTAVTTSGFDEAKAKAQQLADTLNGLHSKSITIDARVSGPNGAVFSDARQTAIGKAAGGAVDGPGPVGVDSVRAVLAPGEHVWTAREVAAAGGQDAMYRMRADVLSGYATGGEISAAAGAVQRAQRRLAAATKANRSDREQELRDARARLEALRNDREDFVSGQRRGGSDPLGYVDELRSMSRDSNYSAGRRQRFDDAANRYERSLVSLGKRSEEAAAKVKDLKDASAQMRDSISSTIRGGYSLSGAAGGGTSTGNWVMRDGIRYQTTTSTAGTAAGIAGFYQAGAASARTFADALKSLATRGVNSQLLAELAGMGTEAGLPIAQAILSGSAADIAGINAGYTGIAAAAGSAGKQVADANYAAQIAAADRSADRITNAINTTSEKLRKIIAQAFGLKGYATGTTSAAGGIRWVGENGPELLGFRGGERMLSNPESLRWIRGQGGGGGAPAVSVAAPTVHFPDTITVKDLHGFKATMRVIATEEISRDAANDAVLIMGGAA